MNPEQLLKEVEIAIAHRPPSLCNKWSLLFYHGRICCDPNPHSIATEYIIAVFNEEDAEKGFGPKFWNQTRTRLTHVIEELNK